MLGITAAIAGMFFKFGMMASSLHYHLAWIFFDPHVIVKHFQYVSMFKYARPFLGWNPLG